MNHNDYILLLKTFDLLKKISCQLDDIAARLPMPAMKKEYKDIAFENIPPLQPDDTGNFKYPTAYRSAPTKTAGSTND